MNTMARKSELQRKRNTVLKTGVARLSGPLVLLPFIAHSAFGAEEKAALEEVVVVGTKRELSIQEVPEAITALDGELIENLQADNFADYLELAPGVQFNQAEPNSSRFSIRGLATDSGTSALQNTVGIYVDDVPLSSVVGTPTLIDPGLVDLQRVEIMRGPQGVLYGSASLGGALNIVTADPDFNHTGGRAAVSLADTKHGEWGYGLRGHFNVPIIEDQLALRVSASVRRDGGYVDNPVFGKDDANRFDEYSVRAKLAYRPTDRLEFELMALIQESENGENNGVDPSLGDFIRPIAQPNERETEFNMISLQGTYQLNERWSLFGSGAYVEVNSNEFLDVSPFAFLVASIVPALGVDPGLVNPVATQDDVLETYAYSAEFRLDYQGDRLRGLAGLFYRDEQIDYQAFFTNPGLGDLLGPLGPILAPNDVFLDQGVDAPNEEIAVFGEISYDITEKLELVAGLRYFETDILQNFFDSPNLFNFGMGGALFSLGSKNTGITPKVSLSYDFSEQALVYALASKGYRAGLGNNAQALAFGIPLEVDEDTVWNYEAGLKAEWYDGRLTTNLAVFYLDWEDIQLNVVPVGSTRTFRVNGAAARSYGMELEVMAEPMEGLSLSTGLALINAQLQDPDGAVDAFGQPILPDRDLPGTPDFQIASALQYQLPLGERQGFIRLEHRYVGDNFSDLPNTIEVGDYHIFNLRAGVELGGYSLTLFAENLFDDDGTTYITPPGAFNATFPNEEYLLRPRTIGITGAIEF